ncbi:MAG TPA: branched-chain amino acid ABC transporter ATP-binding protein/permease, partial [Actinomycetota bacterium]|nr:branched-chain amino acid ABC transporter ATP-binding protein/permease [Actinomycetota bacterium]
LDVNVTRTKLGRAFHAIRENESVAQSFAVDVTRYKLLAFVISGALAGAAGSMYGTLITFVESATFRYDVSLTLVVMVVVGGLASRPGVTIAAVAFALLPRLWANLEFLRNWEQLIGAFLLMDLMSRHPGGIAGAIRHARERKGAKAAQEAVDVEEGDAPMPKLPALPRPEGLPERPREESGAPLLSVREVSVRFGGLQALDEASLDVHRGQIVGLIGPNGAGKTTLFNVVSGLIRPENGSVWFEGREVTSLPPHERSRLGMGRTFQQIGLAGSLSVMENMLLAQHSVATYDPASALAFLPAVSRKEVELRDRARQAVEALGFERFADTPVRYLSHGQQRLVELACSLITAPELLLLDEPSAGMAPAAAENLAQRLKDLRDELGRTVLLIEHHIPLVLDVCDHIYVLNFGQVLASGSTEEIAAKPDVIAAYFGEQVGVPV